MAIKTIDLVINTSKGEQNVKKLHQLAKQVEKTFGNLNKLKINIKTAPAQKKLSALEKEINKGNRKIKSFLETANPGMRFFGNSIGKARDNLAAVRKAFDDATSATARQNGATTLLAGNFRKLRMEAVAFAQASGADPSKTIGNVSARIKEIQGFPRTIMAGNEAMTLLKRMQDMTIAGSKEFLLVSKAIGEQLKVNATIQMQASRAAKPMTASTAFVTQEQINALGKNKLVPPSMRLPAAGQSSGTFEIESKPIEKAVKNIQKSSAKTANILTQQSAFGLLPPAGGTTSPINRPGRFSATNLGFGRNANPQGIFAMPGGMTGRLKGAAGSAMIGGGFPALFGAGGISSIMGGIAGGVGGALAPGGGFAASILATAAAAQIEKTIAFRKELNKVNLELESMGIASTFSRKQIKELAKEFKITNDEAIKLATTFKTFGAGQADMLLSAFGSREVFDTLSGLRTTEAVLGKIEGIREEISETTRQDLLQTLATKGSLEAQAKLERIIFEQRKKAFVEGEIDKIKILDIGGGAGIIGKLVLEFFLDSGIIVTFHSLDLSKQMLKIQLKNNIISGTVVMDMSSMTNNDLSAGSKERLIGHLKSPDFFHVTKFPKAKLNIKSSKILEKLENGKYKMLINADMTIKDKTNPINFEAIVDLDSDIKTAQGKLSFDRSAFGVEYRSEMHLDNPNSFWNKVQTSRDAAKDKVIRDMIEINFNIVSLPGMLSK